MKRFILLIALLLSFAASALFAQVQRRVIEEEFTNTGCPPCAATDPFVETFENQNSDKICVLKYHTSWPDPADPFYNAQKVKTWDDARCTKYYGQNGVPYVRMSGKTAPMTRIFDGTGSHPISTTLPGDLVDSLNAVYTITSPFTIDITQQIVGDSIIALVTIKAVSTLPTATDLRLACVFGERFNAYHGSNGRPYYTNIVREVMPGIATDGSISTSSVYPVFTITNGATKTIRFADTLNSKWNTNGLFAVAFIQSAGTKEIFQSNWTVPNIVVAVDASAGFDVAPSSAPVGVTFTNKSNADQKVSVHYAAPDMPSNWKPQMDGADANGIVTVPANSTKVLMVGMSVTGSAVGSANGAFFFSSGDGVGLGGVGASYFGSANTDAIIDGGAGISNLLLALSDMNNSGLKAGIADRTQFNTYFSDWSTFKTIYIAAGNSVGIQTGTNEWQNLSDHLNAGGNVLFTGTTTIADYQSSGNQIAIGYWRDNFHIEPSSLTSSPWSKLTGVSGDPISNNVSSTLSTKNPYRQDLIPFDAGFRGIFTNERGDTVGMRALTGTGKVVFLTFELESLAANDQMNISKKIIDWFNGAASVKTSNEATAMKISNYPNPVSKTTKFDYSLTQRGIVNLVIFDVMGREVSRVVSNETEDAGTYSADFDASHLSNGSYTYVLTTESNKVIGTMTVTK